MSYKPKQGDLVWINFDPSVGIEIKKRRPAIVVSTDDFNRLTHSVIVCPTTSTKRNYETFPYYELENYKTHGYVVTSQLRTLDYTQRKIEYIEHLRASDLAMIGQLVGQTMHINLFK